ncbi:MAG: HAD family hydrolase [Actinomycetota bacterium]
MEPLPDAVLFDCDGTLADTEPISARSWADVLGPRGYQLTDEDIRAVLGHPYRRSFAHFSRRVELGEPKSFAAELRASFQARMAEELTLHQDAVGSLRAMARAGVPIAVVSSSSRAHVERVLAHDGLGGLVTVIVGADDVEEHKPHPLPYQRAAWLLGVATERCSVVEDSEVGVAAGVAAGCFVVGVDRGIHDAAALVAADRVVTTLTTHALIPPQDVRA